MRTIVKRLRDLFLACGPEAVCDTIPKPSMRQLDRLVKDLRLPAGDNN